MSEKPRSKNIKYSGFLLTINTNQKFTGHEINFRETVESFMNAVSDMYKVDGLKSIIKCKDTTVDINTLWNNNEIIKDISINSTPELGPSSQCLHIHSNIIISHYTKIHLDKDAIQSYMKEKGFSGCHVHFSYYTDSAKQIKDYVHKTVPEVRQALKNKRDTYFANQ